MPSCTFLLTQHHSMIINNDSEVQSWVLEWWKVTTHFSLSCPVPTMHSTTSPLLNWTQLYCLSSISILYRHFPCKHICNTSVQCLCDAVVFVCVTMLLQCVLLFTESKNITSSLAIIKTETIISIVPYDSRLPIFHSLTLQMK